MFMHNLIPAAPSIILLTILISGSWLHGEEGSPAGGTFPEITNSQKPGDEPPPPHEALKKITLPAGFHASLFAAEPDVRQPISLDLDSRGRLWVAECYTYERGQFKAPFPDRLIILEDTDHDGRHDRRKVFWDKARQLTSVLVGLGGVWLLNNGKLIYLADRDRDDRPDGEPVVHLEGFNTTEVGHNMVNGLRWGPDGWIYARHGIQGGSAVKPPGSPESARVRFHSSMWRYHPVRKKFRDRHARLHKSLGHGL